MSSSKYLYSRNRSRVAFEFYRATALSTLILLSGSALLCSVLVHAGDGQVKGASNSIYLGAKRFYGRTGNIDSATHTYKKTDSQSVDAMSMGVQGKYEKISGKNVTFISGHLDADVNSKKDMVGFQGEGHIIQGQTNDIGAILANYNLASSFHSNSPIENFAQLQVDAELALGKIKGPEFQDVIVKGRPDIASFGLFAGFDVNAGPRFDASGPLSLVAGLRSRLHKGPVSFDQEVSLDINGDPETLGKKAAITEVRYKGNLDVALNSGLYAGAFVSTSDLKRASDADGVALEKQLAETIGVRVGGAF